MLVVWSVLCSHSGQAAAQTSAPGKTSKVSSASADGDAVAPAQINYRFDEGKGAWNGTAGEVKDSGGKELHGKRVKTAESSETNAVPPNPTIPSQHSSVKGQFCNAGKFDGNGAVRIPANDFFNFTTTMSATAWIYPTEYPKENAATSIAILSNDANYELNLIKSGNLVWWWEQSSLSSASKIELNKWTHIAITFNSTDDGKRQHIYFNGVSDAESKWTGTLGLNPCDFYIGADGGRNGDGRDTCTGPYNTTFFKGMIDEVKIYNYELSAEQVKSDMTNGRSCGGTFDHVRIVHDGLASSCYSKTVNLKACADSGCSSLYTGDVEVTLTPAGWVGGDKVKIKGGWENATLPNSAFAGKSTLTLGTSSVDPSAANSTRCFNGATETCDLAVQAASCDFDAVEKGSNPQTNLLTKLAGTGFDVDIIALKKNSSGEVNDKYSGNATVELVDAAASPIECGKRSALSDKVTATFVEADKGRKTVRLSGNRAASRAQVRISSSNSSSCSYDKLAIRPTALAVSSSADADANGTNATTSSVVKAGANFTLTAGAAVAGYDGTPKVDASLLEWASPPPAGRETPGTGTLSGSFTQAASASTGTGASGDFQYDEAGYFRFKTHGVYDDSFTSVDSGNGDCVIDTATPDNSFSNETGKGKVGCYFGNDKNTDHFGRFIPDHFSLTAGATTPGCGSDFTYFGQDGLTTAFTLTAQNKGNNTTQNYAGSFARLDLSTWASFGFSTKEDLPDGATLAASATPPSGEWKKGSASVSAKHVINRPKAPAGETSATVMALPKDGDAVTMPAAAPVQGKATPMRYGRARLDNANGSELLPLPLPLSLEYWSGSSGWQRNTLDTCTTIRASDFAFSFPADAKNHLAACETAISVKGSGPNYTLSLSTPGTGNDGWADITLNLGAAASGKQCAAVGDGKAAATTAAAPWLRYNWSGSEGNPTARATFGVYGSGPVIYRRERY